MTEEKKKTAEKTEDKEIKANDKPDVKIKKTSEETIDDKTSNTDIKEKESVKEKSLDAEVKSEEIKDTVLDSSKEDDDVIVESKDDNKSVNKKESQIEVSDDKGKKSEQKKKQTVDKTSKKVKKKDDVDEDFQYIVRIANTDIDGNRTIVMGISQIKGIGRHLANLIADSTGIDKKLKMGKLSEGQIEKIRNALDDISSIAPGWMLNHRKDIDSGEDIHLISSDVDLRLRDDINLLKMIRSYRGIRHESGLTVRGQRTRANNRRGLALGVSKKRP